MARVWAPTSWEVTVSSSRFWSWETARLGGCNLRGYSLGQPTLAPRNHLLVWEATVWEARIRGATSLAIFDLKDLSTLTVQNLILPFFQSGSLY